MRGLTGFLLFLLIGAAGALRYYGAKVSAQADAYLRQRVFTEPSKASFESVGIDWLRARLYLRGLTVSGVSAGQVSARLVARELAVPLISPELLLRRLGFHRVVVESPRFEVFIASTPAAAAALARPTIVVPWERLGPFSPRELDVRDGAVSVVFIGQGKPLELRNVSVELKRESDDEGGLSIAAAARLAQSTRAQLLVNARLYGQDLHGRFEGEVRLKDIPIAEILGMFPADPDVAFRSGRLSVNSQFNCKNDWLTASHLVEIKDFKVDVGPKRGELLGVSVKYLKELFSIDQLSFVIPMNGSLSDPHIGIASSVQQILLKILEAKFKDAKKAEKWARWGGDHFGGQIDSALKAWLQRKR